MQTVRRNQLVADTIHFALDSPADGLSVQVAVITLLHAKLMQDIHQRLCAPAGINWRVMQKCNFLCAPPCLQRHAQAAGFARHDLGILGIGIVKRPAAGAAQRHIAHSAGRSACASLLPTWADSLPSLQKHPLAYPRREKGEDHQPQKLPYAPPAVYSGVFCSY